MGARLALALVLVLAGAGWEMAGADPGSGDSIVFPAPGDQRQPVLAFDGTNFLVAWADHRAGNWNWDVYGTRVSEDGLLLDPSGIAISTAPYPQRSPDVAFDGSNYLVIWDDARVAPDMDVYGSRVTPAGTILDPSGIAVTTASQIQVNPALEFDGTNYLVV
jgi:large repetitive protein